MSEEADPTPDQERTLKRERNRPTWAVVTGLLGIFPLALYFGGRALVDRKRALEQGRGYEGWGTASAIAGVVLGLVAMASLGVLLTSQGGGDGRPAVAESTPVGSSTTNPDSGSAAANPSDATYSVGDTFRDGNFGFRVLRVDEVSQIEGFPPTAGATLVRVDLDTTNLSSQPVAGPICALGYDGIVLVDDDARNYSVNSGSAELSAAMDPFCTTAVQPGLTKRLILVFQIPKAVVQSIAGVAVWDPTESGDETGEGTYYFVDARP